MHADLHLYRSLYRNLPPASDVDAAREAVHATREAHHIGLPMTLAFLAMALRDIDADGAMDALGQAEEHAEQFDDPFLVASVAAWGSLVTLALPTGAAATHLAARLDRLQAYYGNAEAALLTLCLCVLRRVDSPRVRRTACVPVRDPAGVTVARSIAPELPDPEPTADAPPSFEAAVALTRAALGELADP